MILLTLAALAQSAPASACDMISFSRASARGGTTEQVSICRGDGDGHFRFHRLVTARGGVPVSSATQTRTCPVARAQLAALEQLQLPIPDVIGLGRELQVIALDGAGYRLKAPALFGGDGGDLTLQSNVGTPLARWIDATLAALSPCWDR